MDHRALLGKYIEHVGACEGVTFLREFDRGGYGSDWPQFTDAEWQELKTIAGEE